MEVVAVELSDEELVVDVRLVLVEEVVVEVVVEVVDDVLVVVTELDQENIAIAKIVGP